MASAANIESLDRTEAAQMAPADFAAYAIVLGVQPSADPHATLRMTVAPDFEDALEDLKLEIQRRLPIWRRGLTLAERQQIEDRLLMGLMSLDLEGDGAFNRVLGGRPVVLARAELIRRQGRQAVAQAAHRSEVVQALAERRPVHSQNVALYGLRPEASDIETLLGAA